MPDKFITAVEVHRMRVWIKKHTRVSMVGSCGYLLLMVVVVSSCATSPRNVLRQGEGPTVLDIMKGDVSSVNAAGVVTDQVPIKRKPVRREPGSTSSEHGPYTRDSLNETRQLFPTLPNPTIALYVHAHPVVDPNTRETLPVPGYTTAFPLYSRVQFAMPGELPASRERGSLVFPAARESDTDAPFADTEVIR